MLRRARVADADAMAEIINGYAARGLMLPKAPAELHRSFREYVVVTDPSTGVVACGGLRVYTPRLAEIVGLATREGWQGRGLGRNVADRLCDEARGMGLERVFAMTLAEPFFERMGFRRVARDSLPEKLEADCRACSRREGCREIAVILDLGGGRPATARRELRVLPIRADPRSR